MHRESVSNTEHIVSSTFDKPVNRRSLVKGIAGLGAGIALATTVGRVAARSTDSLIVNTAGARLHSGPGTGYSVLASLAKGTEVRYLAYGGSANGYEWHKVMVLATGKQGFIAANLLSMPGSQPGGETFTTTARRNLRAAPNTGAKVLLVMPSGAVVNALSGTANGWRHVSYKGTTGWAATSYLN